MQDHEHQHHTHHHDDDGSAGATLTEAGAASPAHHAHHDDYAFHIHGQHTGHSTAMFKNRFWLPLAWQRPTTAAPPALAFMRAAHPASPWPQGDRWQFSRRRARPADHLSWRSMYGMSASTRSFRRANALRFVHQPDVDPAAAWPATLNQPSFTTSLKDNP